ncbi:MAG: class I SAM-dependent methyltransferase [Lachnospiraceae bacterium]|nr:class I SAM-dependent methyltransferase [Lachnospiraceae bacterium]
MAEFQRNFDNSAADYEKSRPLYVTELYNDIWKYQPLHKDSRVLEIGMGTGKATEPILATGCQLTGIEPGENLIQLAREKLEKYQNLSIFSGILQEYHGQPESFDLIYAATAFHWIPEEYGYQRVYELLKKGGTFARFAYHAGPDHRRPELTREIQALYRKYMDRGEPPKEFELEDARQLAQVAQRYGFTEIDYKVYHMTKDFTADEYMELLRTYPDHMAVEETVRKQLFDGIHSAITKHGGTITVYYTIDLELAGKG